MSWNVYLSLIFFFESIEETSKLISLFEIYPEEFVRQFRVKSQKNQRSNLSVRY